LDYLPSSVKRNQLPVGARFGYEAILRRDFRPVRPPRSNPYLANGKAASYHYEAASPIHIVSKKYYFKQITLTRTVVRGTVMSVEKQREWHHG
jgi:hypothetical protein